jgi:integrase
MYLYQRPRSPFYWTEFRIGRRRFRRSTETASRREAEAAAKRIRNEVADELRAQKAKPHSALTLDEACGRYWIEHGRRLKASRDEKRNLQYITRFIDKDLPLAEVSNKHVNILVKKRMEMGAGPAGVNRTLSTLKTMHNLAAGTWEEPVKAIAWKKHKLKEPKERTRWITLQEAQRLLNRLEEFAPHIASVVRFLLLSGVRKVEAFDARWDRLNENAATITLRVKGGHDREVALSPEAMMLLRELPRTSAYVFDTTNWRKHFARGLKEAAITDFRWHDLRHTHATWLGQNGVPIEVVSKQLGHSGLAVTMKYRHVIQREVREGLQKLPPLSPHTGPVVPLRRPLND